MFQPNPYALAALISGLIAFAVSGYSFARRNSPGSFALTLLLVGMVIWSFAYALELALPAPTDQIFWAKVQYFGITTVPVFWMIFALQFNRSSYSLSFSQTASLFLLSVITLVMVWTNESHGLIWPATNQVKIGDSLVMSFEHGPMFWVYWGYSYVLFIAGTFVLLRRAFREQGIYRSQIIIIVVGAVAFWLGNVGYILNLSPFPALDLTPFTVIISGSIYLLGLARYNMLDLVSIASEVVLEGFTDGVLVVDTDNRIIFFNASFRYLTGVQESAIGKTFDEAMPSWLAINQQLLNISTGKREMTVRPERSDVELFELQISPLIDPKERVLGRVIVLRDISGRQNGDLQMRTDGFGILMMAMEAKTGAIVDVNASLMSFTGFRHDQLIGKTPLQVGLWSIPERVQFLNAFRKEGKLSNHRMSLGTKFGDLQTCTVDAVTMSIGNQEAIIWAGMLTAGEEKTT